MITLGPLGEPLVSTNFGNIFYYSSSHQPTIRLQLRYYIRVLVPVGNRNRELFYGSLKSLGQVKSSRGATATHSRSEHPDPIGILVF